MSQQFLFEIGLEELPARVVLDLQNQLQTKVEAFLQEHGLEFSNIKPYSTPRRLAVIVDGLPQAQADKTETVKGPAKKIAVDGEGNWTKAAEGFSKGQGKTVDDIYFEDVDGEEYVFIEKFMPGQKTADILKDITSLVPQLSTPVSMKWAENTFRFIRPVHTVITLLDDELIPSNLFGVESSKTSLGHRFLGDSVQINSVDEYEEKLESQFVIPDRTKRLEKIKEQINDLCAKNNWQSPVDNEDLLNENTDLVEYPTAFYGEFDETFLDVPERILETSMADHQRYFPVRSEDGAFLPYFIGVRNGDDKHLDKVVSGNEKVLVARLEDAKFFYEEDKKHSIADFVEKLERVTYHEKLGSMVDKQNRVKLIAKELVKLSNIAEDQVEELDRVTDIYKFDLVTGVVDEFSSLQGYVGSVYAHEFGEDPAVANAIGEQYLPSVSGGKLPETDLGAILALADKLESLIMFFSIDLVPTGSNDPYALRRTAYGLIRILEDKHLSLDLHAFILGLAGDLKLDNLAFLENLDSFISERLDHYLKDYHSVPYDVRLAASQRKELNPMKTIEIANHLDQAQEDDNYKFIVESLSRVANLAKKNEVDRDVNVELAESESESDLMEAAVLLEAIFAESSDVSAHYESLAEISPKIDAFFENNMVNAEDETIKENRYALLNKIYQHALTFADFNQLITK